MALRWWKCTCEVEYEGEVYNSTTAVPKKLRSIQKIRSNKQRGEYLFRTVITFINFLIFTFKKLFNLSEYEMIIQTVFFIDFKPLLEPSF